MDLCILFYGWMASADGGLKATLLPPWVAVGGVYVWIDDRGGNGGFYIILNQRGEIFVLYWLDPFSLPTYLEYY